MNNDHVEKSLDAIRTIFQAASTRIEAIKPGERVPATVLAAELGKDIGKTGPQVYPVLLFLIKDYPGFRVSRGAKGGIERIVPGAVKDPEPVVDSSDEVAQ